MKVNSVIRITIPLASCLFLFFTLIMFNAGDAVQPSEAGRIDLLSGKAVSNDDGNFQWRRGDVRAIDLVGDVSSGSEGADILALYFRRTKNELWIRVSMARMNDPSSGRDLLKDAEASVMVFLDYSDGGESGLPEEVPGETSIRWEEAFTFSPFAEEISERSGRFFSAGLSERHRPSAAVLNRGGEYLEASAVVSESYLRASGNMESAEGMDAALPVQIEVVAVSGGRVADRLLGSGSATAGEANCAFVHHGNQGLAYTDVFYGRSDDMDGSGFDEALQVHQSTSIPGNFHLCGPLQTSAEWDNNNGDPNDFNGWLQSGVSAGWCGMVTSAYGQHIMPFVQDAMNDWSVNIQTQMTNTRYGYYPRVAWVPERVWLHPSYYPSAGVADDIVDNWESHGVWAVILDDDVHCQGYDNHQIHTISGSTLKVMPRDRNFTGNIVGGNGSAALQILTDLANSGVGEYRIALYAEDWEAAAEMGSWATSTPYAKETYDWFINKCSAESSWINVWKVADAVSNPNFQGTSMNVTFGTYQEIGGTDGYGGGNNGWYTDWAGYVPYANGGDGYGNCDPGRGGNCKDFGTIWNDAFNTLSAAPDNNISQAGWYMLMTNLHETGWHDGMGGDISGWQLKYSGHIKNASMYAEAAHWANGEYASATGAYFADIDNDGYQEMVMHSDRVFAVFEGIGGRAVNIFARGSDYNFSIVGVDNAYWAGTTADYNDVNHVGAFSDVGPNYQHSLYSMEIESSSGDTVQAVLTYQNLSKRVRLVAGEPYLDVVYEVGPSTQYIKSGYSPGLVDLVWNAQMDRIWVTDTGYMGQRNPNNGATAAIVLGNGGGNHNFDFSGRIMKGDEIYSEGVFQFLLFAGKTAAPGPDGEISELRTLSDNLSDTIGPGVLNSLYYPGTDKLRIDFNQVVQYLTFDVTGVSVDDDDDGVPELTLSAGTGIMETSDGYTLTLQLTATDAAALESLDTGSLELMLSAGTAEDQNGNGNNLISNEDNVKISYGAETMITIDGYIDTGEWDGCTLAVPDSLDSGWTSSNEIDGIYMTRDSVYLYLAIDGRVDGNSWILYLDVDPGSSNGETDLTSIDNWERGATFSYPGFACDFQYGCYQHQGQYDSDSFFEITGPTTTVNLSDSIISAFDSMHEFGDLGGSELAIPWNLLYGLGPSSVPDSASISIVASLCWDPEPDGELGGDSAPSNISAALPEIDNVFTFMVDADGDGAPDLPDHIPPELVSAHLDLSADTLVNVAFSEPVQESSAETPSNYTVYRTEIPSQTISVLSAVMQAGGDTVQLALDDPVGYGYSLSVSLVADRSCYSNQIDPGSVVAIEGPVITGGEDTPSPGYSGALYQNYPNPFNPYTTIRFEVPGLGRPGDSRQVYLAVYDISGRKVRTLVSGRRKPGLHSISWDGCNERGARVSSGIYLYRIVSGSWSESRKMVILR